ncbi:MAG: radical SAM protein [Candidatus Moraniibacteriota bacterium]|nr:MAG: radical SAM protein [Candidatus Moranbacteria bacterium]
MKKEKMKLFIKTFGCQQNVADSERIVSYYVSRGYTLGKDEKESDLVVINSCMIRDKAEERVYGYIRNLRKSRSSALLRIVLTGCIVGAAAREPSGKMKKKLEKRIPDVELLSIDEVGFEYPPIRQENTSSKGNALEKKKHGWVVISNGCNNYCAFCIVPFSRGREVSRSYKEIIEEVQDMVAHGYSSVTLLGQNVNSYGSDLILKGKAQDFESETQDEKSEKRNLETQDHDKKSQDLETREGYTLFNGKTVAPVMVKHLGRQRIPTLFPYLLEDIAHIPGIETITFTSSNPWDFSDELIEVIQRNENIDRLLHLPVQSGSTKILHAMNRWYTKEAYLELLQRIQKRIPEVKFITDIIVGFPGETEEDFQETVDLVRQAGFVRAFIACYSERPGTQATKNMEDSIPLEEKKRRMRILNEMTNLAHPGVSEGKDWIRTKNKFRFEKEGKERKE